MRIEVREDVKAGTNICADCGHQHAGREYAWICIGCPCPQFRPKVEAVPDPRKPVTEPGRAFPLQPLPDDPRFTLGLALEVAEVLEKHGYPRFVNGGDLVGLQQALFRFLYRGDAS